MRHVRKTVALTVLAAVAGLAWVGDSHAVVVSAELRAVLDGRQEVPPNASTGFGGAYFTVDTAANLLSYRIVFAGTAETAAHIHGPAAPGVNAGVLQALPGGNPKVGVWNYPEGVEADLLGGRLYVNIHSAGFPGGEIRGQIVNLNAIIDGAQEVPPTPSPGNGFGLFMLDENANTLSYYIVFGGLLAGETAAHIHGTALHGTNAGVLTALPAGNPKVGVYAYPEAQEDAIKNGRTYVNIHTAAFPGGEIRGQIVPLVVPIDGMQEVPPTGSAGAGVGLISYDPDAHALSYDIRSGGLAGGETAAHIHGYAPPGVNAGVLNALPGGVRKLGVWAFPAADQARIFGGLTYINIHSTVNPGGEIRGQIEGFYDLIPADAPDPELSTSVRMSQSFPNPFQDATTIKFSLEQAGSVRLSIFDSQGRLVRSVADGDFEQGAQAVSWDGLDNSGQPVASGVYRYVLQTRQGEESGRLTLVR